MKYQFKSTVPRHSRGSIAELNPDDKQTQERLARGIIVPYNPVKETQAASPVRETKKAKKAKADG